MLLSIILGIVLTSDKCTLITIIAKKFDEKIFIIPEKLDFSRVFGIFTKLKICYTDLYTQLKAECLIRIDKIRFDPV